MIPVAKKRDNRAGELTAPMIAESTSDTATIASKFATGAPVKYLTVEINAAAPPAAPL